MSRLFLAGFVAATLVGTAAGSLVDSRGRRAGCVLYAAAAGAAAASVVCERPELLLAGRVVGGIGTSLLAAAPEASSSAHCLLGSAPARGDLLASGRE